MSLQNKVEKKIKACQIVNELLLVSLVQDNRVVYLFDKH